MTQQVTRIRQEMKTPRAAAVAGILFSPLGISSFLLFRISIPPNPLSQPSGMVQHSRTISLALYLLPFAGIAFLWFMGVIRDRLGDYEDRFFATVFLGSGLLFVGMIFTGAAEVAGIRDSMTKFAGAAMTERIAGRAVADKRTRIVTPPLVLHE